MIPVSISIIIPAFNIEGYLTVCLDSIVYQVNNNIEVIIVNDGSTDNTGSTADSYALRYSFIKVIHQSNQGVSAARNRGLIEATGDYIWFVDGDDYLPNKSFIVNLFKFLSKSEYPDLVFLNMSYCHNGLFHNKVTGLKPIYGSYLTIDLFLLISHRVLMSHPCDKLIKRQKVLEENINFSSDLIVAEDFLWNYHLLLRVDRYAWFPDICYVYRTNRYLSASSTIDEKKLNIIVRVLHEVVDEIIISNNKNKVSLLLFSSAVWFHVMPHIYSTNPLEFSHNKNKLKEIMSIYDSQNINLGTYVNGHSAYIFLKKYFGYNIGSYIYARIVLVKRSCSFNVLHFLLDIIKNLKVVYVRKS